MTVAAAAPSPDDRDAFAGMNEAQLRAVLRAFAAKPAEDILVSAIIDAYMVELAGRAERKDIAADYFRNASRTLRDFRQARGHKSLAAARQHDLSAFILGNPLWKSAYTQAHASAVVTQCFTWAVEQGLIAASPFKRVKPTSTKGSRNPCLPSEYVALMRRGNRALRRLLFFLRRTSCRTSEARALTWDDCRLDDGLPHVLLRHHKTFQHTKQPRLFGLDAGTTRFLRALKRQAPASAVSRNHVFLNCEGRPYNRRSLALAFRRLRRVAGLSSDIDHRISAYSLRHMYVTECTKAGTSSRKIADQIGHVSTQMIDRVYGKSTRANLAHLGTVADEATRSRLRERRGPKKPG
jgi:integrase